MTTLNFDDEDELQDKAEVRLPYFWDKILPLSKNIRSWSRQYGSPMFPNDSQHLTNTSFKDISLHLTLASFGVGQGNRGWLFFTKFCNNKLWRRTWLFIIGHCCTPCRVHYTCLYSREYGKNKWKRSCLWRNLLRCQRICSILEMF